MAAMLVARIESRGPETVGISSNTKVSGPRPIPPESCRPVPSPKNRVTVTNDATLVSQINSHLSGPSSEPLDKEIERRKSSASEIAHQRETLGRRRLESSSTEYENVHISHYTLIRVLPPMDW